MVTHLSTNPAQRRVTSLMHPQMLPLTKPPPIGHLLITKSELKLTQSLEA